MSRLRFASLPAAVAVVILLHTTTAADSPAKAEFASKEHKFKATFPDKPKATEQKAAGVTFTTYGWQSKNGAYVVGVADLPIPANETAEMIQERLDGARDGAIKNINGKQTASKAVTLDKHPGREFSATVAEPMKGVLRARVYLVGTRLYQVMVVGTEDFATNKEATDFLNSFKLTE